MKTWGRLFTAVILGLFFAGVASADTLELKDGRVLQGRYLGGTLAVLRFEVRGEVQTFSVSDVVAVTFTGKTAVAAPAAALAPTPAPAVSSASRQSDTLTIPAGQTLLVRMIDGVDSSKNHVGDVFHASLETNLTVNDQV